MIKIDFLAWILIAGYILIMPPPGLSADAQNEKNAKTGEQEAAPETTIDTQVEKKLVKIIEAVQGDSPKAQINDTETAGTASSDKKEEEKSELLPSSIPVYKPPIRGAPVGRVAGGTRGILDEYPSMLCVISPNHTALTLRSQPQFHWFLREATSYPVELTVIEDRAVYPMLETQIKGSVQPGIGTIRLADYDIRLREGVTYRWFVSVVPDPESRSKDILAWGSVRYIKVSDELRDRLSQVEKETVLGIYAQAGIWYDAFADISDMIQSNPDDLTLIAKRKALLEQVGLAQILQ